MGCTAAAKNGYFCRGDGCKAAHARSVCGDRTHIAGRLPDSASVMALSAADTRSGLSDSGDSFSSLVALRGTGGLRRCYGLGGCNVHGLSIERRKDRRRRHLGCPGYSRARIYSGVAANADARAPLAAGFFQKRMIAHPAASRPQRPRGRMVSGRADALVLRNHLRAQQ
jgi:hypothetical protein